MDASSKHAVALEAVDVGGKPIAGVLFSSAGPIGLLATIYECILFRCDCCLLGAEAEETEVGRGRACAGRTLSFRLWWVEEAAWRGILRLPFVDVYRKHSRFIPQRASHHQGNTSISSWDPNRISFTSAHSCDSASVTSIDPSTGFTIATAPRYGSDPLAAGSTSFSKALKHTRQSRPFTSALLFLS